MIVVDLPEWGRGKIVKLTDSEFRVASLFPKALRLENSGRGRFRITSRGGWVGSVALSRDVQLVIRPKVSMRSFFSLCALAYGDRALPHVDHTAQYAEADPSDWLALALIASITRLSRGGIRRGYVEIEERPRFLRGRVLYGPSSSSPANLPMCRYSDFSLDIPENRALKAAILFLVLSTKRQELRSGCMRILDVFSEVQSVPLKMIEFSEIRLTRLTVQYRSALALAELLSKGRGFSPEFGSVQGPGLFFPIAQIFERAVYQAVKIAMGTRFVLYQPDLTALVQYISGKPSKSITLRPDVALSSRPTAFVGTSSFTRLVVDAKYKAPLHKTQFRLSFRNQDIYQIMAYGTALQCPGLVVYPQFDEPIDVSYILGPRHFRLITADVDDDTLSGFIKTIGSVVSELTKTSAN